MKQAHIVFAALFAVASVAQAQSTPAAAGNPPKAAAAAAPMSDGEVRKVDKDQGKLTLKHGPIANLDMPGMTMVFKVADRKLLDAVKVGDKVKFSAENLNGAMTVTAIEAAK
jgi:Cu/Ag efflux protein CusF